MQRSRLHVFHPLARLAWPAVVGALLVTACGRAESPEASSTKPTAAATEANPTVDPAEAYFHEVAEAVGLDFVHVNGMSGQRYFVEPVGSGAALFDMDGDGDLDVYLVQGHLLGDADPGPDARPGDRLYRNDLQTSAAEGASLHFTDVTEQSGIVATGYGMGVAAGDYDGDGWVDLYVTNWAPNQLWRNRGDGTFEDVTEASGVGGGDVWSTSASFLDYDRDGQLDLFVVNYDRYSFDLHHPCFEITTGTQDYCGPGAYPALPDLLLHNRGDGSFEDMTSRAGLLAAYGPGLGVVAADFDGDGWTDIYVTNDGAANQLWMNREGQRFEDRAMLSGSAVNRAGAPEAGMGVVAEDFDGDGDIDLFMAHLSGESNTYYENQGQAIFRDMTQAMGLGLPSIPFTSFGIGALDVDNDGWTDLFVANGEVKIILEQHLAGKPLPLEQPDQLFLNLGHGHFEDSTAAAGPALTTPAVSRGVAAGDVDNDGDTDLLVVDNNAPLRLLINEIGNRQAWLGLVVSEDGGQRAAIGARVRLLRADGTVLWGRVHQDGSYCSSNDPRLRFGLGASGDLASATVYWLDGGVEHWTGLAAGAYHLLLRGQGSDGEGS